MSKAISGIETTQRPVKPAAWNVDKIQAALCILVSACVSLGFIGWGAYAVF